MIGGTRSAIAMGHNTVIVVDEVVFASIDGRTISLTFKGGHTQNVGSISDSVAQDRWLLLLKEMGFNPEEAKRLRGVG